MKERETIHTRRKFLKNVFNSKTCWLQLRPDVQFDSGLQCDIVLNVAVRNVGHT